MLVKYNIKIKNIIYFEFIWLYCLEIAHKSKKCVKKITTLTKVNEIR